MSRLQHDGKYTLMSHAPWGWTNILPSNSLREKDLMMQLLENTQIHRRANKMKGNTWINEWRNRLIHMLPYTAQGFNEYKYNVNSVVSPRALKVFNLRFWTSLLDNTIHHHHEYTKWGKNGVYPVEFRHFREYRSTEAVCGFALCFSTFFTHYNSFEVGFLATRQMQVSYFTKFLLSTESTGLPDSLATMCSPASC